MTHPAVLDPGEEVAPGVRIGLVVSLQAFRHERCRRRPKGHNYSEVKVAGRTISVCLSCGKR